MITTVHRMVRSDSGSSSRRVHEEVDGTRWPRKHLTLSKFILSEGLTVLEKRVAMFESASHSLHRPRMQNFPPSQSSWLEQAPL